MCVTEAYSCDLKFDIPCIIKFHLYMCCRSYTYIYIRPLSFVQYTFAFIVHEPFDLSWPLGGWSLGENMYYCASSIYFSKRKTNVLMHKLVLINKVCFSFYQVIFVNDCRVCAYVLVLPYYTYIHTYTYISFRCVISELIGKSWNHVCSRENIELRDTSYKHICNQEWLKHATMSPVFLWYTPFYGLVLLF